MSTVQPVPNVPQGVIDLQEILQHTKAAHAALDKADAIVTEYEQQKAACAAMAPLVYQELLKHRRIDPAITKEAAERVLSNPVEVMNILIKAADPSEIFGKPEAMGKSTGPASTTHSKMAATVAASERKTDGKVRDLAAKLGLSV